jgi:hypothetical protein
MNAIQLLLKSFRELTIKIKMRISVLLHVGNSTGGNMSSMDP